MEKLFKIINRMKQIILFLLIIVLSVIFLISAQMIITTKGLSFTDWLIGILITLSLAGSIYLMCIMYKLHAHFIKWDQIHEKRLEKEQALINNLNENDPEWLTKRKLNLLRHHIKREMKEFEKEKDEHDKIVM